MKDLLSKLSHLVDGQSPKFLSARAFRMAAGQSSWLLPKLVREDWTEAAHTFYNPNLRSNHCPFCHDTAMGGGLRMWVTGTAIKEAADDPGTCSEFPLISYFRPICPWWRLVLDIWWSLFSDFLYCQHTSWLEAVCICLWGVCRLSLLDYSKPILLWRVEGEPFIWKVKGNPTRGVGF